MSKTLKAIGYFSWRGLVAGAIAGAVIGLITFAMAGGGGTLAGLAIGGLYGGIVGLIVAVIAGLAVGALGSANRWVKVGAAFLVGLLLAGGGFIAIATAPFADLSVWLTPLALGLINGGIAYLYTGR